MILSAIILSATLAHAAKAPKPTPTPHDIELSENEWRALAGVYEDERVESRHLDQAKLYEQRVWAIITSEQGLKQNDAWKFDEQTHSLHFLVPTPTPICAPVNVSGTRQ